MSKLKVFISSVQREFAHERQTLASFIRSDALLGKFFDPFIFEELPALDNSASQVYLREVSQCHIYIGLIGTKYGFKSPDGISPTEAEYDEATKLHKTRFIFLTSHEADERDESVNRFIDKIQSEIVRHRFLELSGLIKGVYESLLRYLEEKGYIQSGPFDAQLHPYATLEDIDQTKIYNFVKLAKSRRGFALDESHPVGKILHHLHLMRKEQLTHAALLLFGKKPGQFFPTANVKCAVFHGLTKSKPIPSFKILEGDVFALVDLAIEFVMSRLDFGIGTRAASNIAPGQYEIPREVVAEAIVNALAHRDYASNASVEIILYKDRLEISNPGSLPLGWTTDMLKQLHNSVPNNPLLAHPMYLAGYIEQLGTGTEDMIQRLGAHGLPEPQFVQEQHFTVTIFRTLELSRQSKVTWEVTPQDTPQGAPQDTPQEEIGVAVRNLIKVMVEAHTREELQGMLQLKDREFFRETYLNEALKLEIIERTIPDKPTSKYQKYRLTAMGKALKAKLNQEL